MIIYSKVVIKIIFFTDKYNFNVKNLHFRPTMHTHLFNFEASVRNFSKNWFSTWAHCVCLTCCLLLLLLLLVVLVVVGILGFFFDVVFKLYLLLPAANCRPLLLLLLLIFVVVVVIDVVLLTL